MTPCEPRLIKKLQPPLTDLISTTPAVSLLYECVHTCIIGGMFQGSQGKALAKLCVDKLAAFLDDPDQNCESFPLFVRFLDAHSLFEISKVYCLACAGQDCSFPSASCCGTSRADLS